MEGPAERRKAPRHVCDRTFDGVSSGGEESREGFRCHAVNASSGGLMLETTHELKAGQRIDLSMLARDNSRSFVAEAEVVWTKRSGDVFRSGVRFLSRREDYVV